MLEDVTLYVAENDPWDIAYLLDAVVELTTRGEPASERNSSGSNSEARRRLTPPTPGPWG